MIYHVAKINVWNEQKEKVEYTPPEYADEGFIHCSYIHQIGDVISRYYSNEKKIIILSIDEPKLISELKIEYSESSKDDYPHIYGAINRESIVDIEERELGD